jgi:hypothetical protein
MSRLDDSSTEERFRAFAEELAGVIGNADRAGSLRDYCTGLLLPPIRGLFCTPIDSLLLLSDPSVISGGKRRN